MATETADASTTESTLTAWQRGVVAGIVGSVTFGVMLTTQMTPVIEMAIPAPYGLSGAAAGYGVVLWAVLAVLVMPVWLQAVGFAGAAAVPNVSVPNLVGHVVYGAVVGAVYAATSQ